VQSLNAHKHLLFLAATHGIVAIFEVHAPLDHLLISCAYLSTYTAIRFPSAVEDWARIMSRISPLSWVKAPKCWKLRVASSRRAPDAGPAQPPAFLHERLLDEDDRPQSPEVNDREAQMRNPDLQVVLKGGQGVRRLVVERRPGTITLWFQWTEQC
jgi:hypothetical protein